MHHKVPWLVGLYLAEVPILVKLDDLRLRLGSEEETKSFRRVVDQITEHSLSLRVSRVREKLTLGQFEFLNFTCVRDLIAVEELIVAANEPRKIVNRLH